VFSRVTTSGLFVPNFDGLRFIAITLVVWFHIFQEGQHVLGPQAPPSALVSLVSVGWLGVTLFFAISGFVLALPFANHYLNGARAVALPQYYLRRVTRLEPPYMICLLAYFGIKAFIMKQAGLLPHLLASMTYTHNIIYSDVSTINGVAWSLEIEVQFYILAPLLAQIFRISSPLYRRGVLILTMTVIGILTDCVLAPRGTTHSLYLVPQLNYFLTGFLLADVFATKMAMGKAIRRSFVWDLLGTGAWVLIFVATCRFKVDSLLFPALIFIAYLAALRGIFWNAFTSNRLIFTVGGMCYTIYLWHNFVIEILLRKLDVANHMLRLLGPGWFWVPYLGVVSFCVLAVSGVLFALFEKPFMFKTWPRDFAKWVHGIRPRQPAAPPIGPSPRPEEKVCS
jgi:peptidoglycan/LPS O-acetylase OafA/YrhL